jgi:hypothetical protein
MNSSIIARLALCFALSTLTMEQGRAADSSTPGKPLVNAPAAGSFAGSCATFGYACPAGLACTVIAEPPRTIPPLTFVGYQCRRINQFALLPGQCPPGYVTGSSGCKPGPAACVESVKPAWLWWNKTTIHLADGTGYQCPFTHSSVVNSQ